jgi:nucleoside-diphosphate-sugar epimerase
VTNLSALFIGGTGTISSSVSQLAVERGIDLTILNRGLTDTHANPSSAHNDSIRRLTGDATDASSIAAAIGKEDFDVVVNFRSFLPTQVAADVDLFTGRTGQYVYISSASAYQKPPTHLPITESTPLKNPFWQYSRDKIASEEVLVAAYRDADFPMTIVRPSHTYDQTSMPIEGGWTTIDRMRRGEPVVVHGDGTSLWTLTHARDLAKAFVGLLGNPAAIGDAFTITSDFVYTWDAIYTMLATAAGVEPKLVHVASDTIGKAFPEWADGIIGDKSHSVIFDNTKVKTLVPSYVATTTFAEGAREIIDWYDGAENRRVVDADVNARLDKLIASIG